MKDIIDQIIQIDSIVFEDQKKNDEALKLKKEEYESLIREYRVQKIDEANKKAKAIYEDCISKTKIQCDKQEQEIIEMNDYVARKYNLAEKKVISKIFNKLFLSEN